MLSKRAEKHLVIQRPELTERISLYEEERDVNIFLYYRGRVFPEPGTRGNRCHTARRNSNADIYAGWNSGDGEKRCARGVARSRGCNYPGQYLPSDVATRLAVNR